MTRLPSARSSFSGVLIPLRRLRHRPRHADPGPERVRDIQHTPGGERRADRRLTDGRDARAHEGKRPPAPPPLGLSVAREDRRIGGKRSGMSRDEKPFRSPEANAPPSRPVRRNALFLIGDDAPACVPILPPMAVAASSRLPARIPTANSLNLAGALSLYDHVRLKQCNANAARAATRGTTFSAYQPDRAETRDSLRVSEPFSEGFIA